MNKTIYIAKLENSHVKVVCHYKPWGSVKCNFEKGFNNKVLS